MLAAGDTAETILREYPPLEPEGIQACLRFARRSIAGEHVYDRIPVPEASWKFLVDACAASRTLRRP